ncbi:MAG TPA: hypothetical protein VLG37_01725 [Candidatus Saccharimonadales bacterium]|nr:hypothetical protein [Candidatus Saccharimonadales bacterium]
MSEAIISRKDVYFATFLSAVSVGLKFVPPLNRLVVGNNNIPRGWHCLSQPASDVKDWVRFDGDPGGTRLPIPRLYNMAGIVAVEAAEMASLQTTYPADIYPRSKPALAIKFGEAMVVGALARDRSFVQDPDNEGQLLTGARIGHGDLEISAGLLLPDIGLFVGAKTVRAVRRVQLDQVSPELAASLG